MPDLAAQITATGITAPTYAEILESLQDTYRGIFGSDVNLDADTQDGEFLAAMAAAINDANQGLVAAFNAFSPTYAQGAGLSSLVRINGIARSAASHSTATVTLTGVAGTVVSNGIVTDADGNRWDLPASVVIGGGGTVSVTATAQEEGDLTAGAGTITNIATPTRGWQSVTNAADANPGLPVETDAALRQRQKASVAFPASTVLESISAAVGNVTGVGRYFVYENDTDSTDADGIPAHSIAVVCEGGDGQDIAEAIASRKPPGIQTYGDESRTVVDSRGVPATINFFFLEEVALKAEVTIADLVGYVGTTGDKITEALAEFVNTLGLGVDSYLARLYAPAGLNGAAAVAATGLTQAELDVLSATYHVTLLRQAKTADPFAAADVAITFSQAATLDAADVTVIVV